MKELYKITFNCLVQPQAPYFSMPMGDIEEELNNITILRKTRNISANNAEDAIKCLRHKWTNQIDIINVKKENEYVR